MAHTLFATYSGRLIDFNNIKKEDICLGDIAHHLTKIQRFGGTLPIGVNYSVASHSLNLCNYFLIRENGGLNLAAYALMHDATEAYLGDVVSGLKHILPDYKKIESNLHHLICEKYGLDLACEPIVSEADSRIVLNEISSLNPDVLPLYGQRSMNKSFLICPVIPADKYPERIKRLFLGTCQALQIKE